MLLSEYVGFFSKVSITNITLLVLEEIFFVMVILF